jgi:hypothetical protein
LLRQLAEIYPFEEAEVAACCVFDIRQQNFSKLFSRVFRKQCLDLDRDVLV